MTNDLSKDWKKVQSPVVISSPDDLAFSRAGCEESDPAGLAEECDTVE